MHVCSCGVSLAQVRAEELSQNQSVLELQFSGQGLDKKVGR